MKDPKFWSFLALAEDGHPEIYGAGVTHAIVSEESGGVIAYTHSDHVETIVSALN